MLVHNSSFKINGDKQFCDVTQWWVKKRMIKIWWIDYGNIILDKIEVEKRKILGNRFLKSEYIYYHILGYSAMQYNKSLPSIPGNKLPPGLENFTLFLLDTCLYSSST
jgi:hypothetical protein